MRAIQYDSFGPPDVLHLVELPIPEPGPGEVLVRVDAAGVGPGDCKTRAGLLGAHHATVFPKIPGRNGAGRVVAVGEGVSAVSRGDAVAFFALHTQPGTCVEFAVRPETALARLPPRLSAVEAVALVQPALCAWIALVDVARLVPGMALLVHAGAGAVGGQAVQLGRHLGARVTATARASDIDHVRELGAEQVIPFDAEDFSRSPAKFDAVFDLLGGEVHRKSYEVLVPGGLLVCLNADPIEDLSSRYGVRMEVARIEDDVPTILKLLQLAEAGVLKPRIAAVLPMEQAAEAHRLVETGRNRRGRTVLTLS